MRTLAALLVLAVAAGGGAQAPAPATDSADWLAYSNRAHGYELRHPPAFEVRPTGPAQARDGRSIRIARRNHAAPSPVLDVEIAEAGTPAARGGDMISAAIHTIARTPVTVNGVSGTMTEFRFVDTGELTRVVVDLGRVRFTFHASADTPDFRKSDWWRIVESFRFRP